MRQGIRDNHSNIKHPAWYTPLFRISPPTVHCPLSTVHYILLLALITLLASCTFDYGETEASGRELPDMIMENVEYVRVRSADPLARIQAERAERYEKQGLMILQNFSFQQYGERGEEVNAYGSAGNAEVKLDTSDVIMNMGVRIEVESEDIIIETNQLEWKDEPRLLYTGDGDKVFIFQNNGTGFSGIGLNVDTRKRLWEFKGNVDGTFIHEDKAAAEEEPAEAEGDDQIE